MLNLSEEQAEQIGTCLSYVVLAIGLYIMSQFEMGSPLFLCGLAFVAMALHEIID